MEEVSGASSSSSISSLSDLPCCSFPSFFFLGGRPRDLGWRLGDTPSELLVSDELSKSVEDCFLAVAFRLEDTKKIVKMNLNKGIYKRFTFLNIDIQGRKFFVRTKQI